jgi:hypothetical protein
LAGEIVRFPDQGFADAPLLLGLFGKDAVMARDFTNSFVSALRSPPDKGVG